MKTPLLLLLCCLLSLQAYTQERKPLQGRVLGTNGALEKVHVKNISTTKYAVSDADGIFRLKARPGDTLVFSHVGMRDVIRFLEKQALEGPPLVIYMEPVDTELSEVEISDHSEINAVSLGIIPKKVKPMGTYERRMHAFGSFNPKLGLSNSLPLIPILNAISGRTKKMKKNLAVEKKMKHLAYLEGNYMEYMRENMELSNPEIHRFLSYLVEQENLQAVIESGNENQLLFYLHDQWLKYSALVEETEEKS